MASYIARASGNFSTVGNWYTVDATSLLDSEAGNTEVATAPAWGRSASFTPGAITIDGIAVKLRSRAAAGAYTVSVRLYDVTGAGPVAGTTVTINLTDLPIADSTIQQGGWVLFSFVGAPVLLLGGGNQYAVEAQESNASADVTLWRNGTASNWARMLRTTTSPGALAAGSIFHIMGEYTGPGARNDFQITMDLVAGAITDFGSGVDNSTALTVSKGGSLNYGFAGATDYYLKLSGNLYCYRDSIFSIGVVGSEIPRNSTAVLEFDPVADGGMAPIGRQATITMQGLSRTAGKNVMACLLNTDEAVNSTSLGVDTDTGWLDNDAIAIASTDTTYSHSENGQLDGDAAAAILTVDGFGGAGGGLAFAHSGTSPTQAEIILLTRNVKVRSASAAIMAYVYFNQCIVDVDWVEFYYIGESNAVLQRGLVIVTAAGFGVDVSYVSIHDCEDYGFVYNANGAGGFSLTYIGMYNCSSVTGNGAMNFPVSQTTNITVTDIYIIKVAYNSGACLYSSGSLAGTFTRIYLAGSNGKGLLDFGSKTQVWTYSYVYIHSCTSTGWSIEGVTSDYWAAGWLGVRNAHSYFTIWKCNYGVNQQVPIMNTDFSHITIFDIAHTNAEWYVVGSLVGVIFTDCSFDGRVGFGGTGMRIESFGSMSTVIHQFKMINCSFGTSVANAVDINVLATTRDFMRIYLENVTLASPTPLNVAAGGGPMPDDDLDWFIKATRLSANTHKSWFRYGIIETDTTYFNTASPSEKVTPNNASSKMRSSSKQAAVDSGGTLTFSVWVRKSSVAAGGADYGGNQPRLVLRRQDSMGVAADTVLQTMTVGLDTWEHLIGAATPVATENGAFEVFVDCDGTTGFINVDDWTVA